MGAYAALIANRLGAAIREATWPSGLGVVVVEILFILDEARNLGRRPDVAFVSSERWPLDREMPIEGDFVVVPDLVVEVLSPNDISREVAEKRREYRRYGVRQVWTVILVEWRRDAILRVELSRALAEEAKVKARAAEELRGSYHEPGRRAGRLPSRVHPTPR